MEKQGLGVGATQRNSGVFRRLCGQDSETSGAPHRRRAVVGGWQKQGVCISICLRFTEFRADQPQSEATPGSR